MNAITLKAYAKINLSLDIVGRRADGYHDIESFMQGVDLCDTVTVEWDGGPGLEIALVQNVAGLPTDERNLAVKGARAFEGALKVCGEAVRNGETSPNCESSPSCGPSRLVVTIDKQLPIAAGIAGGSGNAAAVMLGMNALAGNPFTLDELMAIGAKVGADVPFSIFMNAARNRRALGEKQLAGLEKASVAAMTRGIGDKVAPAEPIGKHVIMMNPGVPVSTAEVYKAIDDLPEELRRPGGLWTNMMEEWTLRNVAEAAVLKAAMQDNLRAERVLMSGSGPTMVAFYDDEERAKQDYERVSEWAKSEWRAWLTQSGKE